MDAKSITLWMQSLLNKEGCLYQDDVVDYVIKAKSESFLRENQEGNLVLGQKILNEFKKLNAQNVVWVVPDKYWRFRVPEDEEGREAMG